MVERAKPFGCTKQLVNLIMATITRHIFINIFQTEHFLAVKFDMGYEQIYELSCGTKISNSWENSQSKMDWLL